MARLFLSNAEYEKLIHIQQTSDDKRLHDRARAMMILGQGESINRTAELLKVSPRTIYTWLHRFTEDNSLPIETRLKDKPRSGRPHKWFTAEGSRREDGWFELPQERSRKTAEEIKEIVQRVIYEHPEWNTWFVFKHIVEVENIHISMQEMLMLIKPPRADRGEE